MLLRGGGKSDGRWGFEALELEARVTVYVEKQGRVSGRHVIDALAIEPLVQLSCLLAAALNYLVMQMVTKCQLLPPRYDWVDWSCSVGSNIAINPVYRSIDAPTSIQQIRRNNLDIREAYFNAFHSIICHLQETRNSNTKNKSLKPPFRARSNARPSFPAGSRHNTHAGCHIYNVLCPPRAPSCVHPRPWTSDSSILGVAVKDKIHTY